jgi:hypothetical protein
VDVGTGEEAGMGVAVAVTGALHAENNDKTQMAGMKMRMEGFMESGR